ncbi:MAG: SpoIIE family protein phosphatase [Oligoflexales bacterium]
MACIIEIAFLRDADEQFLRNQAMTITSNASGILAKPLWAQDKQNISNIIDQYNNFEQVIKIIVLDKKDQVIASYARKSPQSNFSRKKDIYYQGSLVGRLQIHFSRTIPDKQNKYLFIAVITLIGLLVTCLFTTIFVLRNFLHKPFMQIINSMESIGNGKKIKDLPPPPQIDLSKIVKQTNVMAKAILDREENLKDQQQRLMQINNAITWLTKASSIGELIRAAAEVLLNISNAKTCTFSPNEDTQIDLLIDKIVPFSIEIDRAHTPTSDKKIMIKNFNISLHSKILGFFELQGNHERSEIFEQDIPAIISLLEELIAKLQVIKVNMMNLAEMKIAQSVQEGMLLATSPNSKNVDLAFLYLPMDKIGGDWFRVWSSPDNENYYLMLGDVTGHGVGSGLVTTAVNGTLQTLEYLVKEKRLNFEINPENIMDTLNHLLKSISGSSKLHMTCVVAKLSVATNELSLCNAGHTFPLIVKNEDRKTQVFPLTRHQQPMLGEEFSKDFCYKSAKYSIAGGDYLLLYTDGLMEAQDENRQAFSRSFIRMLKHMDNINSADSFKVAINKKLEDHCQDTGIKDDICLAIMKKV